MSFTIKVRGAGGLFAAEYECPVHGRFAVTVERDANGDPPATVRCDADAFVDYPDENGMPDDDDDGACGEPAEYRISAPGCCRMKRGEVVRGGSSERPPGALDTRPLADGMPFHEWEAMEKKRELDIRRKQLKAIL